MDSNTQIRSEIFKTIDSRILDIYGNEMLGDISLSISEKLSLSSQRQADFVRAVGDTVLGIFSEKDFMRVLCSEIGISEEKAIEITSALSPYFKAAEDIRNEAPIQKDMHVEDTEEDWEDETEPIPEETAILKPQYAPVVEHTHETKPLTREDMIRALSAKRTMATDIEEMQRNDTPSSYGN